MAELDPAHGRLGRWTAAMAGRRSIVSSDAAASSSSETDSANATCPPSADERATRTMNSDH
jgi:hypothetical protein